MRMGGQRTLRQLCLRERPVTHCIGGWVGLAAGLDECRKSRPHRDSISGPSTRSESLYRLSYPAATGRHITIFFVATSFDVWTFRPGAFCWRTDSSLRCNFDRPWSLLFQHFRIWRFPFLLCGMHSCSAMQCTNSVTTRRYRATTVQWENNKNYVFRECVFVPSMKCAWAILSSVACPALLYISTLSHKRYDFL